MLYFLDVIGDTGLKLSLFLELYPLSNQMLNEFIIEIKDLLITNISEKSMRNSAYSKITIHGRFSEIIKKLPIIWKLSSPFLSSDKLTEIYRLNYESLVFFLPEV